MVVGPCIFFKALHLLFLKLNECLQPMHFPTLPPSHSVCMCVCVCVSISLSLSLSLSLSQIPRFSVRFIIRITNSAP